MKRNKLLNAFLNTTPVTVNGYTGVISTLKLYDTTGYVFEVTVVFQFGSIIVRIKTYE